jgi:tetratricopeptide (TPR) repeat protein
MSYGKASSYLPIVDLLKTYFKIEDRDDSRLVRAKVTGTLLTLDESLRDAIAPLLLLLDALPPEDPLHALDPPLRRLRTLGAIKSVLLRESRVQPLVLVFEDLHWIDSETQAFLDAFAESLPGAAVLLAVNYRPEYRHSWGSRTYYSQLRMDPLPPDSAEELLKTQLGEHSSVQPLKRVLIQRAEGNPLFLEESVRTLAESNALVGERGAYRLTRDLKTVEVPATVQAILAARIDRLEPADKQLLQAASVIGKDVPFALMAAIADRSEEELQIGLGRLVAAEFLYEAQLFPDLEYSFKHALTYEVAYGSLLHDRRRALHARIVETMEQVYGDRLTEHVDRIAQHAFRGELWAKAATYLRQAGQRAGSRTAHPEAVLSFELALAALRQLGESRETTEQMIDVTFDLRNSLYPLGELEKVVSVLRSAEALARSIDDRRRLGWVSMYLGACLWLSGELDEALRFGNSARVNGEKLGDMPLVIGAHYYLGSVSHTVGNHVLAENHFGAITRMTDGPLLGERCGLAGFPAPMSRAWLAWSLAERGRFPEALEAANEGCRLAEQLEHRFSLIFLWWGLGQVHRIKGDWAQVIHLMERALGMCREAGLTLLAPYTMWLLGTGYIASGSVNNGLSMLEQTRDAYKTMGHHVFQPLLLVHLGEAYLAAGRLDDAAACADEAIGRAREQRQRSFEVNALRLSAEIEGHHGDPRSAERGYGEALAGALELAMRPLAARCHLGMAAVLRHRGDEGAALARLGEAREMFRQMQMTWWAEKAEVDHTTAA